MTFRPASLDCLFFHRWSPWRLYIVHKERTCERCGLVQRRKFINPWRLR